MNESPEDILHSYEVAIDSLKETIKTEQKALTKLGVAITHPIDPSLENPVKNLYALHDAIKHSPKVKLEHKNEVHHEGKYLEKMLLLISDSIKTLHEFNKKLQAYKAAPSSDNEKALHAYQITARKHLAHIKDFWKTHPHKAH